MTATSLSVVLPALNEVEGIARALRDAVDGLEDLAHLGTISRFEVLVIDDGSSDGTAEVVERKARADPRIRLLRHDVNHGVGAAYRTGLAAASAEVILYTDADMPVRMDEIARALPLLESPEVAIVAGQRARYGADGWARTFASRSYDRFARITLGVRSRDVNFPFKLMSVSTALELAHRSDGALVDAELLARAAHLGRRVEVLEMEYRARQFGESKTMSFRLLSQLGIELVRNRSSILRDEG